MLVLSIAGVDDVGRDAVGEELGGTGSAVADHHHVDPHRLQVARRVDQVLAFADRGRGARDVHRVRRESLLRELEGDARSCRGLVEQIDDGLAAKGRDFLDLSLADLLERLGDVEDGANLIGAQRLEAGQILAKLDCVRHPYPVFRSSTASFPSWAGTSTPTS